MTVFIAHSQSDRAAAEALEKYLERRGFFVELEDGARAFHAVQRADTVVTLWSSAAQSAPNRQQIEQRAKDASTDGQLVLVKLDRAPAPAELAGMAAIDARGATRRDGAWAAVAKAAQVLGARAAAPDAEVAQRVADPVRGKSSPRWIARLSLALLLAGAGAGVYVRRDLLTGMAPERYQPWLPVAGAALAFLLLALVFVVTGARAAPSRKR